MIFFVKNIQTVICFAFNNFYKLFQTIQQFSNFLQLCATLYATEENYFEPGTLFLDTDNLDTEIEEE